MNRPSGRNAGRTGGKSADNNKKPYSSAPRGAKRAGDSKDKPFKKSNDDAPRVPYNRGQSSSDRPSRGDDRPAKPYGDKKFDDRPSRGASDRPSRPSSDRPSRDGDRPAKPYGDKRFDDRPSRGASDRPSRPSSDRSSRDGDRQSKPYGDKKFGDRPARPSSDRPSRGASDRPSRPSSDRPSRDGDRPSRSYGDKPVGRGESKSSYRDYESKGKSDRPAKPIKQNPDADNERSEGSTYTPKPKYGKGDEKAKRPRLEDSKKSKYQIRKDNLSSDAPKKSKSEEGGLTQTGIRLNKFIANSGMCSRREADIMIQNGVVSINGNIMDEVGYRVKPDDVVKFDGRTIIPEKPVYLLLNKPKDYITTAEDPQGRKTVMALIQGACKERVFPVGRLDRNTTGLLLFTNDGEMADKLIHPRKKIKKIYMVELDKNLKPDDLKQLREGITLEDGPIKPDLVEYADAPKPDKKVIGVEIHSGRNRIVRRMFEHFGYKIIKLDRVYIAGLTKKNLPRGHFRMLDPMEINMLKML